MSATHSAAITQNLFLFKKPSNHRNVSQFQILMLAWSARVILYGESAPGDSPAAQLKPTASAVLTF
jgi:hypothetical protein